MNLVTLAGLHCSLLQCHSLRTHLSCSSTNLHSKWQEGQLSGESSQRCGLQLHVILCAYTTINSSTGITGTVMGTLFIFEATHFLP